MIIVDTGFWLALANPKDKHHGRAVESLQNLQEPLIGAQSGRFDADLRGQGDVRQISEVDQSIR